MYHAEVSQLVLGWRGYLLGERQQWHPHQRSFLVGYRDQFFVPKTERQLGQLARTARVLLSLFGGGGKLWTYGLKQFPYVGQRAPREEDYQVDLEEFGWGVQHDVWWSGQLSNCFYLRRKRTAWRRRHRTVVGVPRYRWDRGLSPRRRHRTVKRRRRRRLTVRWRRLYKKGALPRGCNTRGVRRRDRRGWTYLEVVKRRLAQVRTDFIPGGDNWNELTFLQWHHHSVATAARSSVKFRYLRFLPRRSHQRKNKPGRRYGGRYRWAGAYLGRGRPCRGGWFAQSYFGRGVRRRRRRRRDHGVTFQACRWTLVGLPTPEVTAAVYRRQELRPARKKPWRSTRETRYRSRFTRWPGWFPAGLAGGTFSLRQSCFLTEVASAGVPFFYFGEVSVRPNVTPWFVRWPHSKRACVGLTEWFTTLWHTSSRHNRRISLTRRLSVN